MLKNKKHGEVMQPYALREAHTLNFLRAINPLITYEVSERFQLGYQPKRLFLKWIRLFRLMILMDRHLPDPRSTPSSLLKRQRRYLQASTTDPRIVMYHHDRAQSISTKREKRTDCSLWTLSLWGLLTPPRVWGTALLLSDCHQTRSLISSSAQRGQAKLYSTQGEVQEAA